MYFIFKKVIVFSLFVIAFSLTVALFLRGWATTGSYSSYSYSSKIRQKARSTSEEFKTNIPNAPSCVLGFFIWYLRCQVDRLTQILSDKTVNIGKICWIQQTILSPNILHLSGISQFSISSMLY